MDIFVSLWYHDTSKHNREAVHMTLGQRLIQLRGRAGLSQDALAERLGVSRQSVSKWETDASVPELDKLVHLAALAVLAWRTLRNPPGLGACWGIWAGLLAALWLPVVRIFSMPLLQPTSVGEVLINFFPLLFPYYYRNAPLGAVLWWCYVLFTVYLIRRTLRPAKRGGNGTSQES